MSKRPKAKRPPSRHATVSEVLDQLPELSQEARRLGLDIRVSEATGRGVTMLHVMLDDDRGRVLEWWPSNGTTYSRRDGSKGRLLTGSEVVLAASRISGDSKPSLPSEQEVTAPVKPHPLYPDSLNLPGRCVKCGEEAPKRFDGLCAFCYYNSLG